MAGDHRYSYEVPFGSTLSVICNGMMYERSPVVGPKLLEGHSRQPGGTKMATDAFEEDLIRRVKNRDEDAWSELYDLHYPNLYRYAFARLRSRAKA